MIQRKKQRLSTKPDDKTDLFDGLPDDLLVCILAKLSSSASSPSDFINILLTCKRLNRLALHPLVLSRAGPKALAVKATSWSDSAHRFLKQCVTAGNTEACYVLGMEKEASQVDLPPARFQRTDQWIPVYSWLESLDQDDVVKSKDISDWLAANPQVKEQLCSRHSRYHLMHYIKKCHLKILKRKEKKGLQQPNKETALKVHKDIVKPALTISSNPLINIPKDSDLYVTKRNEALRKYEILVELEKKLAPMFSKPQTATE